MLKTILKFFTGAPRLPAIASVAAPPDSTDTFNLETPPVDPVVALRGLSATSNWVEMAKRGRALLDAQPDDVEVLELLAYSLQQQGQYGDAIELCERTYAAAPERWMTNFLAGVSFKSLGMPQDACVWLSRAADIAPDDAQTARLLLECQIEVDGADASLDAYRLHRQRLGFLGVVTVAPVQNVRDWALGAGLEVLKADEQEEILYETPHVWGQSEPPTKVKVIGNSPYVVEIPDARISSRSSLILTSDNTVLSDVAGHPEFGKYVGLSYEDVVLSRKDGKFVLDFEAYDIQEIAAGIWMSGLASNAFGHWLPEFLPKLQFFAKHPDFSSLPIIIDDDMPATHIEHLRRLVGNPLLILPAKTSFVCRRLLVAPTPTFSPVELLPNNIPSHQVGALSVRALDFLRQGLTTGRAQPGQRFFLGRKGMKWRRLLNEEEISTDLVNLGFRMVYMEDMTASQQITLFQTAEWIVAPNGSALLNLIFADTNIRLLVLSQSNLFNWGNFQGPMNTLGYSPVFLCGEEADAVDQKHADYVIPLTSVRRALADMGLDEAAA